MKFSPEKRNILSSALKENKSFDDKLEAKLASGKKIHKEDEIDFERDLNENHKDD